MNAYFICVVVHVQMWCVCAQPYVDQTKKIFVLFVCFWKWFVLPLFFKVFQIVFVWKKCFLGVFVTHFICKLSWELNGPILKFFSFTQKVSRLFRDCLASKAYQRNTSEILWDSNQRNYHRKFPDQLLKGISWDICFKLLSSSLKPLF